MLSTIQSPTFLLENCCLLNSTGEALMICPQSNNFALKTRVLTDPPFRSCKTHLRKPISCAKKRPKKSGFSRPGRVVLKLLTFMESNLKILPEPFDLVIREMAAGAGGGRGRGGSGMWKGLGGRSFRLGGKSGKAILGLVLVGGLCLFIFPGGDLSSEYVGILALCFLGAALTKWFKRGVQAWLMGICCFCVLVALGLSNRDMQKCIERLSVRSPAFELIIKGINGKRVL